MFCWFELKQNGIIISGLAFLLSKNSYIIYFRYKMFVVYALFKNERVTMGVLRQKKDLDFRWISRNTLVNFLYLKETSQHWISLTEIYPLFLYPFSPFLMSYQTCCTANRWKWRKLKTPSYNLCKILIKW